MDLDWRVCSRARLSRDARFDGKFFIGVLTTRIYCRPICPARTSKESNVRYYPTAAAAAEAGFRPCLRCRPECSPGTPAWLGTPATVSRALRLIGESGLDDGGLEGLSERLGVGSRHLRRLFLQHLGATPGAVAQTSRLHFAKKLIDETKLPMSEVALAAGFGCVRRFNAAIRNVYHRTPTHIRRLARMKTIQPENQYLFHLRFRPPYNWKSMLAYLAARALPGVEVVQPGLFRRSISLDGSHGYFEVSLDERHDSLVVRVQFGNPRSLFFIIERIRAMFDLNADPAAIARGLRSDPALAPWVDRDMGLRVPGCWDGFELTTRLIAGRWTVGIVQAFGQSLSSAGGLTHLFPAPGVLADARLARIGLPAARAETVHALARAVCERRISFDRIVDSADFVTRLREVSGIGKPVAQYVALRALGEPDAFPSSDLGLRRALALGTARDLELRAEAWRPWRAYAAMHVWNAA
jgi:AraC family transcriptional regulator, regulatory protein of adaptative response / DNA-3-methyladenine glycosylase II